MKFHSHNIVRYIVILTVLPMFGCLTYYQKSSQFQGLFESGNLEDAREFLSKNEKAAEKKDRLLYFMDKGVVEHMLGNYEESNAAFEKAYIFMEDYRQGIGYDALVLISNPMNQPYRGEDFEMVMIHYYKAFNYIFLEQPDKALVEVKRINIKLNQLNDKYEGKNNAYKQDAFAQVLTGLIYESVNDPNNAFISYRNAYNTYKGIYESEFNVEVPEQLKIDLLRMAHRMGFTQELMQYEKEFDMQVTNYLHKEDEANLIVFWLNGLGPIKSENSFNFAMIKGEGGIVNFSNEELGMTLPVPMPASGNKQNTEFGDLKAVRLALPKYVERKPLVSSASINYEGKSLDFETLEDINAIAFSNLKDRMLRELGNSLLRLAVKQAAELAIRQENQDLGALISLVNAVSEKADTRNWQTLPHNISYSRIPLQEGENKLQFISKSVHNNKDTINFQVEAIAGQTLFKTFHTQQSFPSEVN